jgi:hypothetical protein
MRTDLYYCSGCKDYHPLSAFYKSKTTFKGKNRPCKAYHTLEQQIMRYGKGFSVGKIYTYTLKTAA